MEEIPEDSQKELRIALAGPLVNFGIAALLIAAGFLLDARALVSLEELQASLGQASWNGLLAYLTSANLALGLFNLIPAFPMDGGRILRALLAKKVAYAKATRIATQVGQGFALLFGLYGVLSGSWMLLIIAAFVWMGANQENQGTQVKHTLAGTKVNQAMTRSPHTLQSSDTLSRAIELTLSTSQSDFPVLETGSARVVGLLSENDLLRGLQTLSMDVPVQQVMRKSNAWVRPEELLHTAQQNMLQGRLRAVPVVNDEGELQGLLTANDVNEAYRLMSITKPALSISSR
jgi:CBS domain-containing protein